MKFPEHCPYHPPQASHPARGAWIEISVVYRPLLDRVVAPRTGCVD